MDEKEFTEKVDPQPISYKKRVLKNIQNITTIVFIVISGFLYFQNTQLQNAIRRNSDNKTANTLPVNKPTPTPETVRAEPFFPKVTPAVLPTADPTLFANGKTYRSDKLKISMKLPDLWFTHAEDKTLTDNGYTIFITYPVDNKSPQVYEENQKAYLFISTLPSTESLEQSALAFYNEPDTTVESIISIDGQKAYVLNRNNGRDLFVLVNSDTSSYYIGLGMPPQHYSQDTITTFYQILSTVKLLN